MSTIDTSGIDETKPISISPTTQSVRDNFSAIKTQLDNAATDIDSKFDTSSTTTFTRTLLDDTSAFQAVGTLKSGYVVANKTEAAALTLTSADAGRKIFITSDDGGEFTVKYNATPSTYADDGGSYCGTQFIPSGGDGTIGIVRSEIREVHIEWFGADPSASASVNTAGIQNAINYANSLTGGGTVKGGAGTYTIGVGGSISSRDYGILLKSNVILKGEGSSLTTFKAGNSTNMDVLTTARSTSTSNIGLIGFKIDGNQANQTGATMNYWLSNCDDIFVDDVYSVDPTSWGFRLENLTDLKGGTIQCDHIADVNADGIHFLDVSRVALDKIIIDTAGDDGFIIAAENADTHDVTIGELVVTAPVTTAAAGRGILLVCDHTVASAQRNIYNVTIKNAVTYNCKSAALGINAANFYNIDINHQDYGSGTGSSIVIGSATYAGFLRDSTLNIKSHQPDGTHLTMTIVSGTCKRNTLHLYGYNPGDGNSGATLRGEYWQGSIDIDYDPNSTKVSPSVGIDVYGNDNNMHMMCDGAASNLYFRSTAADNTIHLGNLANAVTTDLDLSAAGTGNKFVGGKINSIAGATNAHSFTGTTGAYAYGNSSVSPDANGNVSIAHGLVTTPNFAQLGLRGDNVNGIDIESVDGTNTVGRIKDAAGADVTTGTYTVDWEAKL